MRRFLSTVPAVFFILAGIGIPAAAQETAELPINTGDTAFVLFSAAMVLFMTVGLAFFYGGLVRRKNVLSILMQCMLAMGLLSIQWVLYGYSLAFGPDIKGIIGSLDWAGLRGVGLTPSPDYGPTIPHQLFMIFQAMFAIITPALIIGAFAERMKVGAYCIFIIVWATLVYDPVCHWVWGKGGMLGGMGALDFAGGTVVHITAGVAALISALMLGRREGYPERAIPPHSLPLTMFGAGVLWVGWFGFNAGSALAANGIAVNAFVVTNTAAAAAAITWAAIEWITHGKPTMLGTATGVVAGLVAITPAAGFVGPVSAILIGIGAGIVCYLVAVILKPVLGFDDSLDAFGVHGIGGMWGALATGLFASSAINGADGLFFGNPAQFVIQLKAVAITIVYTVVVTFIILKVLDLAMGLRVEKQDERFGLDLSQHHERGYTLID